MMKRLLYGIAERAPNSFDYLDLEMSKEEVAKSDLRGLFLIGAVLALLLCVRILLLLYRSRLYQMEQAARNRIHTGFTRRRRRFGRWMKKEVEKFERKKGT